MNDQRRQYSYDDLFPERWLHAPDLDGKTVTLTITAAYAEFIENPKKHKKDDPGELCGVLSFKGTKREYVLSKQNAWILKALWGKDAAAYVGKRITLAPVADSSGFTEHGTRILFIGSPDVANDLSFNLPGGKHLTFKKTTAGKQKVEEASVDPVTGEVDEQAPVDDTEPESGASGLFAPPTAPTPEPDAEEPPGRGAITKTSDPVTPKRQQELDRLWDKAVNDGADEAELLAAVCDAVGKPTLDGLTMGEAATAITYLKSHQS
jgi:hypothetical protein